MPVPGSQSAKRILCVDDDLGLLDMEQTVLESSGYEVFTANEGRKALEVLAEKTVDLVLLDFHMPGMDGEAVSREIRDRFPHLPILLFAANPEDVPNRVLAYVNDFLCKGEPIAKLRTVIARLLGMPAMEPPCRSVLRFHVQVPLSVVVQSGGKPQVIHGRSRDLSENGIGGTIEGELESGTTVWLHVPLPTGPAIDTRAQVRHRTGRVYGLEFLGLEAGAKASIRRFCGNA